MPWRNGGGETAEVAAHPPGAALDAFGWRVSLATIAGDGPFSTFRGVDRVLALLDGALALTVGAGPPVRLGGGGEVLRFPGEAPCACRLLAGPATALNVMTRRGAFDGRVARFDPARGLPRRPGAARLLVCAEGEVETEVGVLARGDALILPAGVACGVGAAPARALAASIGPASRRGRRSAGPA